MDQPKLKQRRVEKPTEPQSKAKKVTLGTMVVSNGRFYVAGSDEKLYVYNPDTREWNLV